MAHPPKIIFTTAYKEYAVDALDLDAVDYLLKSISLERFLKAVNKITNSNLVTDQIMPPLKQGFLYFRPERKMVKVFLDDMVYIERLKDYIKIHRLADKPLMVKQSISTIEVMLPPDLFLRIHRSFIISINKVSSFTPYDVEISNIEIPTGRQYNSNLKAVLNWHLSKRGI